mgnify:FL=1
MTIYAGEHVVQLTLAGDIAAMWETDSQPYADKYGEVVDSLVLRARARIYGTTQWTMKIDLLKSQLEID